MNTKLVESIVQIVLSLTTEEQELLTEKLSDFLSEPSTGELVQLAQNGGAFNFLDNEPDLYTLADGEPV
ncbi:MAG: hypothetical protein KME17_24895 [Cyanosarcina radialis HA8281-LM2]|jgi:hypothetical protein|nr:hypothetical protein [Cyanosarcina radialis HA8281-LM2]